MALANEVMLSIKARDQASRQTRAIHRDLTKVQQVGKQTNVNFKRMFDDMQRGAKKSNDAMAGLARSVRGMLGVGTAGAGIALVIEGLEKASDAAGDTELAFQTLGEGAKKSLDELDVLALSKEWSVSISDVRTAWAGLSTGVRDAGRVTSREVEVTLALMQKAGISATQASAAVAAAMNGDMDALASALGIPVDLLGDQEQAFDKVLASGEKSIGPFESVLQSVKDALDPSWHAEYVTRWGKFFGDIFGGESQPAKDVQAFTKLFDLETQKIMAQAALAASTAAGYIGTISTASASAALAMARAASDAEAIRNAGSGGGGATTGGAGSTDAGQNATDAAADAEAAALQARLAAEASARHEREREEAAAEIARRQGAVTPDPYAGPGAEFEQQGVWMAEGGVATRATRAIIGEKGPEAVIPLDKMGGMGGFSQTIVLNNPQFNDEFQRRHLTRQINRLTREEWRRHGGAIA